VPISLKSVWLKAASPPHIDGSIVFAIWCQCDLPWGHTGTIWNLCFLQPTRVYNPNGKSIGSAVFALLTVGSPYTLPWAPLSSKIALSCGVCGPPSNTWFTRQAHPSPQPKWHLDSLSRFCTDDHKESLHFDFTTGHSFPRQNCPFPWRYLHLPSNTWFPGPIRVFNQNGISISSAIFAGLTDWLTDRLTPRYRYSIGNNRSHLCTKYCYAA